MGYFRRNNSARECFKFMFKVKKDSRTGNGARTLVKDNVLLGRRAGDQSRSAL